MNFVNPTGAEKTTSLFSLRMVAVLAAIPTLLLVAVIGVTGYFRLSSDVVALRQSFMNEVDGSWQKKFAIHLGPLTTAFVRMCSHWAKVEPEPAAALETIRVAEVGVYNISCEPRAVDAGAILARADKAMSSRGWERAVGVCKEQQLVAVYLPRRSISVGQLKGCLLVYQNRDLVVASARGTLQPLLQLATKQIDQATTHFLLR